MISGKTRIRINATPAISMTYLESMIPDLPIFIPELGKPSGIRVRKASIDVRMAPAVISLIFIVS
jgi:hypothetical protein